MLTQQLRADLSDSSGTLTITAAPGALAELQGLAEELDLRPGISTQGQVHVLATDVPPLG